MALVLAASKTGVAPSCAAAAAAVREDVVGMPMLKALA